MSIRNVTRDRNKWKRLGWLNDIALKNIFSVEKLQVAKERPMNLHSERGVDWGRTHDRVRLGGQPASWVLRVRM